MGAIVRNGKAEANKKIGNTTVTDDMCKALNRLVFEACSDPWTPMNYSCVVLCRNVDGNVSPANNFTSHSSCHIWPHDDEAGMTLGYGGDLTMVRSWLLKSE